MSEVEPGAATLVQIAVLSTIFVGLTLVVLRKFADGDALRKARSRSQAHFLEIRIFADEPAQMFQSYRALVADQFRILWLLAIPLLVLSLAMVPSFWALDSLYGRAPLKIGEAALVSVPEQERVIEVPEGVVVETLPVFIRRTGETSWRIRPMRPVAGIVHSGDFRTRMVAGSGIAFLPRPLAGRPSVDITYPRVVIVGLPWFVWFGLFSVAAAVVLRKPMGAPL